MPNTVSKCDQPEGRSTIRADIKCPNQAGHGNERNPKCAREVKEHQLVRTSSLCKDFSAPSIPTRQLSRKGKLTSFHQECGGGGLRTSRVFDAGEDILHDGAAVARVTYAEY